MSRRTQKNVAVIGLGIIGSRVREVLRNKDFHVFVWNRTPRPIPNFVGAPVELAEMCNYIQLFVSDDDALLDVVKQLSPGIGVRHIVIAHSTVSPHSMIAAAEIVQRRGARFLEAPFTGSKEAAAKGQLVYYVGGDQAALKEARPVLEASSKEIIYIGDVGQATTIKITTNMVTAATVQSVVEALALTQAAGLPLDKFVAAMKGNASNSPTLDLKLPKIVSGDYEPHFSIKHMLKDMQIASRMGLTHHLELGVTSASRDRLLEQMQRGHGDEDYSAVARKYFATPAGGAPQPEAGLELFEPQPAPVEPGWIDFTSNNPPPAPAAPPPAETAPQNVGVHATEDVVPLAPPVAQPVPAAPVDAIEPVENVTPNEEFEEQTEQRRGFLGDCYAAKAAVSSHPMGGDPLTPVFFDLSARTKLRITGQDRHRYVNGQITNDLRKVSEGKAIAACILNAKGKTDAHVFISRDGESLIFDADPDLRETLPARLERYVIADDVQIADVSEELSILHLLGMEVPKLEIGRIVSVNRFGETGTDIWFGSSERERVLDLLGQSAFFFDADRAEVFRIEQGIPRWGRELTPEIIPVEANLEESCIDYQKGCYIGQEVISRMKMSGQRNKRLCGFIAQDESRLTAGARLISDEKREVGWITSAVDSGRFGRRIALGYIKRGADAPDGINIVDLPFSSDRIG